MEFTTLVVGTPTFTQGEHTILFLSEIRLLSNERNYVLTGFIKESSM